MSFPVNIDKATPAQSETPQLGAGHLRTIRTQLEDLFGLPDATVEAAAFLLAKTGDARWGTLMQKAREVLMGDPNRPGTGVLPGALFEDLKRWSLPSTLGDSLGHIGYDRLKDRDWAVM